MAASTWDHDLMLDAEGLTLWRGDTRLFEDLSFGVSAGKVLLVRGPNGAGKTTLLRVLCGLTRAEAGQVRWNGRDDPDSCRETVAYAGHTPALKADLTLRQNLDFYARLAPPTREWPGLVVLLGLDRCLDLEVRHLSAGQKRRASLARLLLSGRPAWLLDEPFTNVDAAGRRFVEDRVAAHVLGGGLAVMVAHDDVRLPGVHPETLTLGGG